MKNFCKTGDYESMETLNYMPFIILGGILGTLAILIFLSISGLWRDSKRDHEKMTRFMQYMDVRHERNSKNLERISAENQKLLAELKQFNKDNAIYLRMIFERVDGSQEGKSPSG